MHVDLEGALWRRCEGKAVVDEAGGTSAFLPPNLLTSSFGIEVRNHTIFLSPITMFIPGDTTKGPSVSRVPDEANEGLPTNAMGKFESYFIQPCHHG